MLELHACCPIRTDRQHEHFVEPALLLGSLAMDSASACACACGGGGHGGSGSGGGGGGIAVQALVNKTSCLVEVVTATSRDTVATASSTARVWRRVGNGGSIIKDKKLVERAVPSTGWSNGGDRHNISKT